MILRLCCWAVVRQRLLVYCSPARASSLFNTELPEIGGLDAVLDIAGVANKLGDVTVRRRSIVIDRCLSYIDVTLPLWVPLIDGNSGLLADR
jgi:hypothetical protein